MKKQYTFLYIENVDVNRMMGSFVCYLNAEGLLGQPATGSPSIVLWGEGVGDAQLLTNFLKGIIANQPKAFQKLFP